MPFSYYEKYIISSLCQVVFCLLIIAGIGCLNLVQSKESDNISKKEILIDPYITLPPYNISLPAYPVAYSEEEKIEQRKVGYSIIEKIKIQIATGQKHLVIPKGIYRYGLKTGDSILALDRVKDIVLDWSGSEIIVEPIDNKNFSYSGFSMNHCENIVLKNVDYDSDPPASPVGQIVAHDVTQQTLTVAILPGYGPLRKSGRFILFEVNGELLPSSMNQFHNPIDLGNGRIVIKVSSEAMKPPCDRFYDLAKQPLIVFENTHAPFHSSQYSKGLVLENINNYSGSMGIWHRDQIGDNCIKNVNFVRRPGTNRLVADGGSQFNHLAGGPQISGCNWEYTYDDPVNVFGKYALVYKQTGPRQAILCQHWKAYELNDKIKFYENGSFNKTMSANITKLNLLQDKAEKNIAIKIHKGNEISGSGPQNSPWIVDFDQDITVNSGDYAMADNRRPSGVQISNCTFKGCFTRPILINGAENVLIENNRFDQSGMSSISVMLDSWFTEGPFPRNVVIRSNTISRSSYHTYGNRDIDVQHGAIFVGYYGVDRKKRIEARNIEGITIENNIIYESMKTGITLSHVKGAMIKNNKVLGSGSRMPVKYNSGLPGSVFYGEMPHGAIYLNNVSDVIIKDNVLEADKNYHKKIVEGKEYKNNNIISKNNFD